MLNDECGMRNIAMRIWLCPYSVFCIPNSELTINTI